MKYLPKYFLVPMLLLTGCANMHASNKGHIEHSVFIWLKEPGNAAARQKLIDRAYTFKSIPGVKHVFAGPMLPSDRKTVDSTYDVGTIIVFDSQESLLAYYDNPIHVNAVKEVLEPLAAKFISYDFVVK